MVKQGGRLNKNPTVAGWWWWLAVSTSWMKKSRLNNKTRPLTSEKCHALHWFNPS